MNDTHLGAVFFGCSPVPAGNLKPAFFRDSFYLIQIFFAGVPRHFSAFSERAFSRRFRDASSQLDPQSFLST